MTRSHSLSLAFAGLALCATLVLAQNPPAPPTPGGGGGGERGDRGGPGGFFGGFGGRGRIIDPPDDFIRPPTMRIGLITVLKQVGGPEAERAIAEVLKTTARGVELAYATAILEKLAPGKYREDALAGAKELLLHPVAFDNPTRYDRDANAYLYGVLLFYKDKSFVPSAQSVLIAADGRLDSSALEYLNRSLEGVAIMPVIAQAYYDPRITNQQEKASLLMTGLRYTGMDQNANRMFVDVMSNEESGFQRFMAMANLLRVDNGGENAPAANNQQLLLARQQLLQSVTSSITDERLTFMAQQVSRNLQNLIEGKPIEGFGGRDGGRGGPPGGFGGPGGPGGFGGRDGAPRN
jgi:hypothetical protein